MPNPNTQREGDETICEGRVRNLAYGYFKPKYRRFRAYFGSYIVIIGELY